MNTQDKPQTIASYLSEPLRVGDPDVAGPLAVFPIFGAEPTLEYKAFAQARAEGFRVGELEGGASVNDLMVENPTDSNVLLFEGEEVLGAQQNRTFDVSVLAAPGAKLRVPVSCVEAGRWQGARHAESFAPAPQAAYPQLRRAKAARIRERIASGMEARADQTEVWSAVADMSTRMGTHSPTGAMHDIFEQRRRRLGELTSAIQLHDRQLGAIVAINGRLAVLDLVSRPDAYATLHGPLVQGYALDALDQATTDEIDPPAAETASGFVLLVGDCAPAQRHPGLGLGDELRFAGNGVEGSALVHDGELVQLTTFPQDDGGPATRRQTQAGRIRRPSRRR